MISLGVLCSSIELFLDVLLDVFKASFLTDSLESRESFEVRF